MNARTGSLWLMLASLFVLTLFLSGRFYSGVNAQVGAPASDSREKEDLTDIQKECRRQALYDTAQLVNKHMTKAKSFTTACGTTKEPSQFFFEK